MPWTQADLDAVNAAISSGAKLVRHGDNLVQYSSTDELIRTRNLIQNEMAQQKGTAQVRMIQTYTASGW